MGGIEKKAQERKLQWHRHVMRRGALHRKESGGNGSTTLEKKERKT